MSINQKKKQMSVFEDFDKNMTKAENCERASNISLLIAIIAITCSFVFDRIDKNATKHCEELFPGD